MYTLISDITKLIIRQKLLNSDLSKGRVFNAQDLTFEEMVALLGWLYSEGFIPSFIFFSQILQVVLWKELILWKLFWWLFWSFSSLASLRSGACSLVLDNSYGKPFRSSLDGWASKDYSTDKRALEKSLALLFFAIFY